MKPIINYFHFIILLILLKLFTILSQGCTQVITRREIRELSSMEITRLTNAINQLNSGPRPTRYDEFARIHLEAASSAHGTPHFFVWHREYILQFEELLRSIDPEVHLPYWDWTLDANEPANSIVLSNRFFGGNGQRNNDYCISEGPFNQFYLSYPEPHCLRRQYDMGNRMSNFFNRPSLLRILQEANSYDQLNSDIEMLPHARVHVNLGGDVGDMSYMYSANDPIFWLHHAFIDRIYYEWQQMKPHLASTFPGDSNQPLDLLGPSVNSVFNTMIGGRYCYRYERMFPERIQGNALAFDMTIDDLNNDELVNGENSNIKPLPMQWIQRNHLDIQRVRNREKELGVGNI